MAASADARRKRLDDPCFESQSEDAPAGTGSTFTNSQD